MNSATVAVIGGSGSSALLSDAQIAETICISTPYGELSAPIVLAQLNGCQFYLVHRHGTKHTIPPHAINYRANIWALAELGAKAVIATATVGSINRTMNPSDLIIPDQLIDYTWGRDSTFFDGKSGEVGHLDMTCPYSLPLRKEIFNAAKSCGVNIAEGAVYAVTQGPRFETPAEINRIENDGGDLVGMTGMPEAALAAEKHLHYACIAMVVNHAAGRGGGQIESSALSEAFSAGISQMNAVLKTALPAVSSAELPGTDSVLRP